MANLSISFNDNQLHIVADCLDSKTTINLFPDGEKYLGITTIGCNATINSHTCNSVVVDMSHSAHANDYYFRNCTQVGVSTDIVKIYQFNLPTATAWSSIARITVNGRGHIDITLKNFYKYTGAFINPPFIPSTDYFNQGFYFKKAGSWLSESVGIMKAGTLSPANPSRWLRMVRLPWKAATFFNFHFKIGKNFESAQPCYIDIKVQYICSTEYNLYNASVEAVSGLSSGANSLSSFRIARDEVTHQLYFEVYWYSANYAPYLSTRVLDSYSPQGGFSNLTLKDINLMEDGTEDLSLTKEFGHRFLGYENSIIGIPQTTSKGQKWIRMLKIDNVIVASAQASYQGRVEFTQPAWLAKVIYNKSYNGGGVYKHAYASYMIEMGAALGGDLSQNHVYLDVKTTAPNDGGPLTKWRFTFDKPDVIPTTNTKYPMYLEAYYDNPNYTMSGGSIYHVYDSLEVTSMGFDDSFKFGLDSPSTAYLIGSEVVPTRIGTTANSPSLVV